ncbi:phage portal protein [Actinomadura sediminis]|uniref:Phage portal protein n=1 Tax=Actinomadura sediminis TaxID=1038904 RepID=A0ABW3EUD3_9ACTN
MGPAGRVGGHLAAGGGDARQVGACEFGDGGVRRIGERLVRWPWKRRAEERAITSVPWDQGGPAGTSRVDVDRALRLAPVYAAGRLLASSVAALPLQTYQRRGGARVKLEWVPELFWRPSVQGTLYDWVFRAVASMVYRGNAVGLVTARDEFEFPTMVEWLNPDQVHVQDDQMFGPGSFTNPIWYYQGRVVPTEDIVHIPWFTLPGRVWGLSPLAAYAASVNVGLSAQQFSEQWFDAGGTPPGTFRNSEKKVDQADANIIKARLTAAIRSRQPIVFGNDWEYTPISVSPNEARFIETMRLGATQIASIYGIPPEMIGGESGASMTYANTEMQQIQFLQTCLLPWLTKLEGALNLLLPPSQYVRFNADALIRADSQTRWANYKTAREIGVMNRDEIRALEDMAPLPDGQGADYEPLRAAQAPRAVERGEGEGAVVPLRVTGRTGQ